MNTTPPTLTAGVNPSSLGSPYHKYELITLSVEASDICNSSPTITTVAQSSEPNDAKSNGDGDTTGDIKVNTVGGDVLVSSNDSPEVAFDRTNDRLELQAKRAGGGGGRTSTIIITATHVSGNQTTATAILVVPHDQGK